MLSPSDPTATRTRPLSPHLQVYRPQITSVLSILHRITGIGLFAALPVFVLWLAAIAAGPDAYAKFNACAHSLTGRLLLMGWVWAFCFHLCTGVRHLLWDAGKFFEMRQVYSTGYIALTVSTLMTVYIWVNYL